MLIYGVCLGDADGLGETRKRELKKSGMLLGLKDEDDVFIVDDQYANAHTTAIHLAAYRPRLTTLQTGNTFPIP